MGKKPLFVIMLGSVIGGMAGVAGSGCSPTDTFTGADATFDSGTKVDGGSGCLTTPQSFGTAQQSTQIKNACTDAELTTLDTMIRSSAGVTYVSLYGMVGASCQKCLFSSASDGNWQSFVWVPDMQQVISDLDGGGTGASTVFDNSVGACIAHVPAGGTMCAVAATQNDECYQTSCLSCTSQSDYDSCENSAAASAQCSANDTRATDCMSKDQYNQALTQCGFNLSTKEIDFKAMFNVTCGNGNPASPGDGGTSEGGTDSGSKDAGTD